MKIRGDDSGFDELEKEIEDVYFGKLVEVGRDAVRFAKENGAYQNHTWNLRNAPGFCVVRNGRIVHMEVGDDGQHPEAVRNTENLLIYSEKTAGDGLYLADGMPYASFVETKGYDVLTRAIHYAEKQAQKKISGK